VRRFHGVLTTALCLRTQVGSVTEHFGQWNKGVNLLYAMSSIHTLDLTTTGVQVTDNITQVIIWSDNGYFHDRLEQYWVAFSHSFFERHRTSDLKCHFRRVDFMVRTIVQLNFNVNYWVSSNNTSGHCALDTSVNCWDVFLRNCTTNNIVDKLVTLTGFVRGNFT